VANIAVVYHSGGGNTAVLAEAIGNGAASVPGAKVSLHRITYQQINAKLRWEDEGIAKELQQADGIIFGCPTLMGMVSTPFKAFMEAAFMPWAKQAWKDKFAGGFTNSASINGDKTNTQIQLLVFAAQMGMLWVPMGDHPGNNWSGGSENDMNRLGAFLGPMSQPRASVAAEAAHSADLQTGFRYGQRFASIVSHWTREGTHVTDRMFDAATAAAIKAQAQKAAK